MIDFKFESNFSRQVMQEGGGQEGLKG
jgi:hypothetical protein